MKIDRLMAIAIYLLNHGKTSAQKLAEEFEVSTRTIMRDMDTLDQAGIPIQSSYGADGGYQIIDTYVMEKQLANNRDYAFIVTALKGLASAYTNKNLEKTLYKMNALIDEQITPVSVDFSVAHENKEINKQIQVLEEAISQKKMVQFQYTNSENEVKQMQVEPACVVYKWFNWYLVGYYEKYQDYCMFKLVRIEHLQMTEKKNRIEHCAENISVWERSSRKNIEIRLKGKAAVKSKCKEYLNGHITKEYENGDFEFCFSVPEEEMYWYGVILSLGNGIRVMEPQSVIDRILATCNDLFKEYGELQ
ncbi:helix-turn-helix transcriptional regulator [Lacrimispora sp.]|uniref:helix-turn-helix transcriptional regulator n=1 Tax=Lacrimispora sp. TaxID=2719234 RepID=UPI002FDAEB66